MLKPITRALSLSALIVGSMPALAAEGAFASYGLGGASFGAGATPPPGTYLTAASAYLSGKVSAPLTVDNTVNAGVKYDFMSVAANLMWVPNTKVLGGNLGLSVTVPYSWLEMKGSIVGPGTSLEKTVKGNGFGDIGGRVQIGWQEGTFMHTAYLQLVAATGHFEAGFKPNMGLNRPSLDAGWGFTWVEPKTKWQVNAVAGLTVSAENDITDYKSGNDFHLEWAIGKDVSPGLTLGVAGYNYRQLTGDSGAGAKLGPLKGSVDAIGPALMYSTMAGSTPLTIAARYYKEFNVENRFKSNALFFTATVPF